MVIQYRSYLRMMQKGFLFCFWMTWVYWYVKSCTATGFSLAAVWLESRGWKGLRWDSWLTWQQVTGFRQTPRCLRLQYDSFSDLLTRVQRNRLTGWLKVTRWRRVSLGLLSCRTRVSLTWMWTEGFTVAVKCKAAVHWAHIVKARL